MAGRSARSSAAIRCSPAFRSSSCRVSPPTRPPISRPPPPSASRSASSTSSTSSASSATRALADSLAFLADSLAFDVLQQDRLRAVVFQLDLLLVVARRDLGRQRHLALADAVAIDTHLDHRERIVDRARTVRRFPEADIAIGGDHHALAALVH